ncbi:MULTISPECIES: penicillin-binding protein 2 [unclassified Pseudonocardia]|uniref:peptidoglycan D,D-transpeptidase FtsI family protein n=1 Tax=unclassified Pseudonocardia TaxID=2619320 RepID=UPI0006CB1721|nr:MULTISPECIES: penicillin-binding protein 2 [unclassified Pseudonocardia]ALE74088.1 cell division protein FtsI [Pseudonocardia sp. EC080625-04]OLM17801.1 Cell division protein FtsI [Peptidoglycan synthetase] [Pseudonocardia sp. Ae707_Ps1]
MAYAPPRPRRPGGGPPRSGGPRRRRSAADDPRFRLRLAWVLLAALLLVAGTKLVFVQTVQAGTLTADAEKQRASRITIPAERGAITDKDGNVLAFSTESKALVTNPRLIDKTKGAEAVAYKHAMATAVAAVTKGDPAELERALNTDRGYVVMATAVDPAPARDLREKFPEIAEEGREARQYPGGTLASNIIGAATWSADAQKLVGRIGLESSDDGLLAGQDGFQVADTAEGSRTVIPGSVRSEQPAVSGSDVQLTIDSDLQHQVQRMLSEYAANSGARSGSAVVLDRETGEVRALADNTSFDPAQLLTSDPKSLGNKAVTTPFEPGSVNKVVTMAAALQAGVVKPEDVLEVPGSIEFADRTIKDAWAHGLDRYTLTGVLAKSSNVGTLMTAQKVGPDAFSDMLGRMGVGQRTGIGLPGESAGVVPPRATWSGSTFGNLPIGQGLSMTVLQMAGMYQAIANDGVRIPPRVVASTTGPDGVRVPAEAAAPVEVMSPQTAQTLRTMLTAVTQNERGQAGTGPAAAVPGYEVAGKTGTAQQVDPETGAYSRSQYWITFAGMLPAQDPRFVIGIMLDAPKAGTSAAPLFHDIASYLAQRDGIPVRTTPPPVQTLQIK